MIIFDQLRISDDGNRMYINAHVNKATYFDGFSIDSLVIMTSDQVSETSPDLPTSNYIYKKDDFEENTKEINLVLTTQDFIRTWETDPKAMGFKRGDISKTLFFVYIKCKYAKGNGDTETCIPCRLDEETTLGVTFDENLLFQRVMGYTKELLKDCSNPTGFVDFILLWNAFKASVETEHYIPAIKFYNKLFDDRRAWNSINMKGCGCHG